MRRGTKEKEKECGLQQHVQARNKRKQMHMGREHEKGKSMNVAAFTRKKKEEKVMLARAESVGEKRSRGFGLCDLL